MSAVLQQPTLVLNRSWQPVNVAPVARALTLVFNDTARIVDPADYQTYRWEDWSRLRPAEGESFIQAVSQQLRVPEVVTVTGYDSVPSVHVAFSRRNLFKRDRYRCQYCGCQPGGGELTIDHVLPRSRGGQTTWENCVLACVACNARKADRTPREAGIRLAAEPKQPRWRPHFAWHPRPAASWSKFVSEAYWNVSIEEDSSEA